MKSIVRLFSIFLLILFLLSGPSTAFAAYNYELVWGSNGSGNGEFSGVWGIATDSDGNVYVSDASNDRVQKFDEDGNYILQWGSEGTANGEFQEPTGIVVNSHDEVIVADMSNHRLQVFDTSGNYIRTIGVGCGEPGPGDFCSPWGVDVDESDNIYISLSAGGGGEQDVIQKFTRMGVYVQSWSPSEFGDSGDGEFGGTAYSIAVSEDDEVFVTDSQNNRVQVFDTSGNYLRKFGTSGSGNGEFNSPVGITIDWNGNLLVVDMFNGRVQVFEQDGTYLSQWGTPGVGAGEFPGPRYISLNDEGKIYVGDSIDRIQRFEDTDFVAPSPSPTPTATPTPTSTSSSSSGNQPSQPVINPGDSVCTQAIPSTPDLFHTAWNATAATVYFSPIPGSSSYVISYGRTGDANEYTLSYSPTDNTGVLLYTVSQLQPSTQYYFKVRAFNGCRPGEWSNIRATGASPRGVGIITPTPIRVPISTIPEIQQDTENSPTPTMSQTGSESAEVIPTPVDEEAPKTENPIMGAVKGVHDSIVHNAEAVIDALPTPAQSILMGISTVAEQPIPESTATVVQAGAIGVGALLVVPKTGFDILTSLTVLKEIPFYLLRILFGILQLLGLRRKVTPWGVVFDSATGQPIDPAVVTLFKLNGKTKSQNGMKITDMAGRFGFLVENGAYTLLVKKTDYVFPSRLLAGQTEFKDYKNLYFGQELSFSDKDLVTVNIPLDAVRENWNQKVKDQYYKQYQQFFKESFITKLMNGIFLVNLVVYVLYPSVFNFVMLFLSILLLLIRKLLVHKKSWGVVYDKESRKVASNVTVRAVKNVAGKDLSSGSVTTDASGRYYMLLSEGEQHLQVEAIKDGVITILKKIGPFNIKKETAFNPDISL